VGLASVQLPSAATYNANNQLISWNGAAMTYDLNGNTLSDGTNTYTWDARNRLVSANSGGAGFSYDALGRRASKTLLSTTTSYLYDGANGVQEQSGGAVTANMLTGGVDEYFQRTDATGSYSYLTDALGSTVALADSTGASVDQYSYGPYGLLSASGSNTNPYTYTGRESDGLGIDYYRARYYNPATGRFLSEDPIGFAGSGTNFYAYAADNPISYRDPTGLANQNLFDPSTDPDLHSAANDWNPSGYYSVAGHGDVYENGISAGTLAGLTPQQLAQLIQKDPNWKKQPIILRSCRTGQGGAKSFAQQLANLLGVQVTAPINDATWWMFPNFFTGNEISLGTTGGNFIPFYPVVGNPNLMWVR